MDTQKCVHCGKMIDGFHADHVAYLMSQHLLTHFTVKDGKLVNKHKQEKKK